MVFWRIDFATNKDTFSIDSAIGKEFDNKADLLKFMKKKKIFMADVGKFRDDGTDERIGDFAICVDGSCDTV